MASTTFFLRSTRLTILRRPAAATMAAVVQQHWQQQPSYSSPPFFFSSLSSSTATIYTSSPWRQSLVSVSLSALRCSLAPQVTLYRFSYVAATMALSRPTAAKSASSSNKTTTLKTLPRSTMTLKIPKTLPFSIPMTLKTTLKTLPLAVSPVPPPPPQDQLALVPSRDDAPIGDDDEILARVIYCVALVAQRMALYSQLKTTLLKNQQDKQQHKAALDKLHAEFKKAHRKFYRVNKEDKNAIYDYTTGRFTAINGALRQGGDSSTVAPDVQAQIDGINKAMTKSLKIHQGTVYRGCQLPPLIRETIVPGATFQDAGFLSSSKVKGGAFMAKPDSLLFVIESKTGRDISMHSRYKKEAEVLFRPKTLFYIESVQDGVVTMRELV